MMPPIMPARPAPSAAPVLRPVRAGDEITVQVEGGFARRRAPADGVVVELADRDLFLRAEALVEALRVLGRAP
jgi:hypothetical protein